MFCSLLSLVDNRRAQGASGGGGGGAGSGLYTDYRSSDAAPMAGAAAPTTTTLELEEAGRMSRLSVDRSLERVREQLDREFQERKLDMYEVGAQARHV